MIPSDFKEQVKLLGIECNENILDKLDTYCRFLIEYNEHTNLTAIKEEKEIYLKHFYDSLTISKSIDLNKVKTLLDIGSGAGFPGIVLKIFFPNLKVTVLDSNNKKTTFLNLLIQKLNLQGVNIINQRAEDYAKEGHKFDVVTSRAVAYIDIITTLSSYFVDKEGVILLMKGDISEELSILNKHQQELGIESYKVINCNITENDIRNIIKIKISHNSKIQNYSQILKRHNKWTNK